MIAITWTDVVQGSLMLVVVLGTAAAIAWRAGSPLEPLRQATTVAPELGHVVAGDVGSSLGYFVVWATAIPVIPHIVMRVFTARDGRSAQRSLNLAMLAYSVMILAAVLVIVPLGRLDHPGLEDADQVFLRVIESEFPPLIRGIAVAAVLAAVMSTTDALLLACSSAVAHDLLGGVFGWRAGVRALSVARVASCWVIGVLALFWALSPPELISRFYTAGIGLLSAGLFVPTIAGLWWKRANRLGGVASLVAGVATYSAAITGALDAGTAPVVVALGASAAAMLAGGLLGPPEDPAMITQIAALHADGASPPGEAPS
jgi:Na+/proline symporter